MAAGADAGFLALSSSLAWGVLLPGKNEEFSSSFVMELVFNFFIL
jgi:hypothetical protein